MDLDENMEAEEQFWKPSIVKKDRRPSGPSSPSSMRQTDSQESLPTEALSTAKAGFTRGVITTRLLTSPGSAANYFL